MLKNFTTKILSAIFILFFTVLANAQIQYEKGYFIDNTNTKTECLIKNLDWKNNPDTISYKLNENSSTNTASIDNIIQFEIYNSSIFVRKTVDVNVNTTTSNQLNNSSSINTEKKTIFLKVLVKGKAQLYSYVDANARLFYYQLDNNEISLLEYKEYLNDDNQLLKNQQYRSQLYTTLKCSSIDMNIIKKLDYNSRDLIDFMKAYNTCMNDLSYTFEKKERTNTFNLTVRPGINISNATITGTQNNAGTFDYDQQIALRIGVEIEYVLPFNNDKWSLTFEPTYQYFKTEKEFDRSPNPAIENLVTSTIDYTSIEIPFGVRHYSYLNSKSRLFFNASVIIDLPIKSEVEHLDLAYEGDSNANVAFGIGYSYNKKFSLEARLFSSRDLLDKETSVSLKYNTISLIFGYTIF